MTPTKVATGAVPGSATWAGTRPGESGCRPAPNLRQRGRQRSEFHSIEGVASDIDGGATSSQDGVSDRVAARGPRRKARATCLRRHVAWVLARRGRGPSDRPRGPFARGPSAAAFSDREECATRAAALPWDEHSRGAIRDATANAHRRRQRPPWRRRRSEWGLRRPTSMLGQLVDNRKKVGCLHRLLKPRIRHVIKKLSRARSEGASGQEDDALRLLRHVALKTLVGLHPRHIRHHDIEQDRVEAFTLRDAFKSRRSAGKHRYIVVR